MNKPELIYDSRGASGNIFSILGEVRRILKKQGRIADDEKLWERVKGASSYAEALEIIGEEVTLIDIAD